MADALRFRTRKDFRDWLASNSSHPGIWLIFGKDDSVVTLTAAEALEEALCFGWIDGLIDRIDKVTYRKYFSPRQTGSCWSERNKALVARLMDEQLMAPQGLEAINHAKQDGTWDISGSQLPGRMVCGVRAADWEKPKSGRELQEDAKIHPATVCGALS